MSTLQTRSFWKSRSLLTADEWRHSVVQHVLALLMLLCEAVTIAYLSGTWLLPLLCVLAALAAVFSGLRFPMDRQRVYDVMAFAAVGFFIKYLLTPDNPRYMDLFASQPIALAVAEYTLTMQVLQFVVQRRDNRLPFMFPGTGVIALTCAAIVDVNQTQRHTFLLSCLVFAGLAALYCNFSRRPVSVGKRLSFGRTATLTIVLLLISGLGWSSATALFRYERDLDELVRRWLTQDVQRQRTGFSDSSQLGSVNLQKQQESRTIMLRIRTDAPPEYIRARAYDVFDGTQWLPVTHGQLVGTRGLPDPVSAARHDGHGFRLPDWDVSADESLTRCEIWPRASLVGSFPSPLNPVWLHTQSDIVTVDSHLILRSDDTLAGSPYTIDSLARTDSALLRPEHDEFLTLLSVPPRQTAEYPELSRLAERLFADCQTPREKIDAATGYFLGNYAYSLRVDVPRQWEDAPVAWFLLEQPAAHCEYFASGAAMLLRLGGVPCRYVTGFVVHEQNRFSQEWVARNRDAHAWVEAWDPERGWVTVEATPSGGLPDEQPVSSSAQFREFLATRFQQLRIEWQRKGFRGLLRAVLRRLLTPVGLTVIGVLLGGVLFVFRRRIAGLFRWQRERPDERTRAFHTVLQNVDRVVARLGFERPPQQTLEAFADSLMHAAPGESATNERVAGVEERGTSDEPPVESSSSRSSPRSAPATRDVSHVATTELSAAADWYRQYARLRYGRRSDDTLEESDDTLEELATLADQLVKKLRRR